jgi:hypothetical protein
MASKALSAGFLLGLFFDSEDGGDVNPKLRLTFNGLHGVISQKIVLFNFNVAPQWFEVKQNLSEYLRNEFPRHR